MRQDLIALDAHRIRHDWSYQQLSLDILRRTAFTLPPRTLHYLLRRAPEGSVPRDRTLYKIRKYLQVIRAMQRRKRSRASEVSHAADAR